MRLSEFTALVQARSAFDPKTIQQWRKDLRRMTKIYRSINTKPWDYGVYDDSTYDQKRKEKDRAKELAKFGEAAKLFRTFRDNFEKWWRYQLLPQLKRDDQPWVHMQVVEKAHRATVELMGLFPDDYDFKQKKRLPAPWTLERERERNIKRYQVAWNEAFKAIEEYIQDMGEVGDRPALEQMDIEGFNVLLRGWNLLNPSDAKKAIGIIRDGLKLYKENAKKRLPFLLKYNIPFHAAWECREDQAATYDEFKGRIKLCMYWPTAGRPDIKRMAHVIAHEMGHHLWKKVLSGSARKFWEAAIDADWGPMDLQRLLKIWPDDVKFSSSLADKLQKTDPTLSLQIEVANSHWGGKGTHFDTKEDLQELINQGKTVLTMKNPITDYAAKNSEEAFCEAVGSLVGYGPRTLHPLTRQWLQTVLPGMRVGSVRISKMIREAAPIT